MSTENVQVSYEEAVLLHKIILRKVVEFRTLMDISDMSTNALHKTIDSLIDKDLLVQMQAANGGASYYATATGVKVPKPETYIRGTGTVIWVSVCNGGLFESVYDQPLQGQKTLLELMRQIKETMPEVTDAEHGGQLNWLQSGDVAWYLVRTPSMKHTAWSIQKVVLP